MDPLTLALIIVAAGLFILAGFAIPRGNPANIHLGWFGMVFLTIALAIHIL